MKYRETILLLAALLSACVTVPGSAPPLPPPIPSETAVADKAYVIGVDDRVQVSVWKNLDLSITVPVRPDGKISVPLIGDVQAGGLTPEQVAARVTEKLTYYMRDPAVAVIVTELRSHEFLSRVRVTGAVRTQRSMTHRQGMTVLDAVLEAGGINEFASPNRSKLYRTMRSAQGDVKTETYSVKLGEILDEGKLETNFVLLPGDVIAVPLRIF
ncbi:MAG: polysaccharide biosynthesis/export family protein [Gammaproteobacteria bacterium]|nr:polysaccharide biosynthesis/export family protein [Gammaproteobacteria bacterium]